METISLNRYRPRVRIRLETSGFVVSTAQTAEELYDALALRSHVFHESFGAGQPGEVWDVQPLDFQTDHLLLSEVETGRIVGTYRLALGERASHFYSSSEFDLEPFLSQPGRKLELSRACTHPDLRGGVGLALLWRGLARYASESGARWLFGCTSLPTENPRQVRNLLASLDGAVDREALALPWPEHGLAGFEAGKSAVAGDASVSASDASPLLAQPMGQAQAELGGVPALPVPPLLGLYLRVGARVSPLPAHDPEFQCVDLFTALDLARMPEAARRRYFGQG